MVIEEILNLDNCCQVPEGVCCVPFMSELLSMQIFMTVKLLHSHDLCSFRHAFTRDIHCEQQ